MIGLFLLAPFFLIIAICIKLDSEGPVFFLQERVGRFGVPFRIIKFRTMFHRRDGLGFSLTVGTDSRITRVGKWLRGSKCDELPQLINVLLGQMSIVGPRPELAKYVRFYPAELAQAILSVRPGITDQAAIEYSDESSLLAGAPDPESYYVSQILPRKIRMYADYARENGFATDFMLIIKTLKKLLLKS